MVITSSGDQSESEYKIRIVQEEKTNWRDLHALVFFIDCLTLMHTISMLSVLNWGKVVSGFSDVIIPTSGRLSDLKLVKSVLRLWMEPADISDTVAPATPVLTPTSKSKSRSAFSFPWVCEQELSLEEFFFVNQDGDVVPLRCFCLV